MFILPIWLLFGTDQLKLSVTATTALFMSIWLVSGLLDIPTGALADRLGRKRMYIIGVGLLSLYPLAYAFRLPVIAIIGVSLLSAFGSALRSGTLMAITHASYVTEKRSGRSYHSFLSNKTIATFIARALSGVTGGALYMHNPNAPYIATFIVYIGMLLIGLFIVDSDSRRSTLGNRAHIAKTLSILRHKQIIVMLFATYAACQVTAEAIWTAYQPFFQHDGLSAQKIGLLFSVVAILSAIGAFMIRFIMRRFGLHLIYTAVTVLVAITAYLLTVDSKLVHLFAILPAAFAFGVTITPLTAAIQKHTAAQFHSTALSVVSVAQYVVYGIGSLYVGLLIDHLGIPLTQRILSTSATTIAIGVCISYYLRRKQDEVISRD